MAAEVRKTDKISSQKRNIILKENLGTMRAQVRIAFREGFRPCDKTEL